ncbi:hypothetical protein ACFL5O_01595 [Myxococcota bacterium]
MTSASALSSTQSATEAVDGLADGPSVTGLHAQPIETDFCPQDRDKQAPGQCGCGVPDTDGDADGVADCMDGCLGDPAKTKPGQCDCGTPDTDSDADGVADCVDGCPGDPAKTKPGQCNCGMPDTDSDADGVADCRESEDLLPEGACEVTAVPDEVRLRNEVDPFYQKYANANGVPVLSSSDPDDQALVLACQLVIEMLSERDDVRQALIDGSLWGYPHFSVIGMNERLEDIPEYANVGTTNQRARGLGGIVGSCGEENILCTGGGTVESGDRWEEESICVHEFAHTISTYGLYAADPTFQRRLETAYSQALASGLWANTYAASEAQEYWAEGVQDWYDSNWENVYDHNHVNTRQELLEYDPALYELIDELLPQATKWPFCYAD